MHKRGNVITLIFEDRTALLKAQRKYEALFNSNVVAINFWDTAGNMWGVNKAYTEMKGYTAEEVEKIKWTDIVHPDDVELIHKPGVEKNKQGIPVKPIETRVRHKNGEYIHILTGYAMLEGSQTEGICMTINITPLKKAESEIQESLRKRDEFLSIASHELKTPLTTIKIALQLIHSLIEEADYIRVKDYILKCDKNIDRQVRLVNELLDISRIDSGKMDLHYEIFPLAPLIELTKDFIMAANTKATVKFEGDFSIEIEADKHRFEQVFYNLISNALKYSENNAALTVSVQQNNELAEISIIDKGIGMESEKLSAIFDRFYRIDQPDRQISGLGLGLYISNEIIRMHNGNIIVTSEPGKGSTFTISIPMKKNTI
jgi:two-component system CheB/CheR fusion protein